MTTPFYKKRNDLNPTKVVFFAGIQVGGVNIFIYTFGPKLVMLIFHLQDQSEKFKLALFCADVSGFSEAPLEITKIVRKLSDNFL